MSDQRQGEDITSTHVMLQAGMTVGHFTIIEKIGSGGMGEVYLAQDTTLDRRVALKFLPAHFSSDPDFKTRFKREAQAAARLDHPNIVTVFEVGEYQGRPFFSMQYVEGQSLQHLAAGNVLPINKIIDLAIQLCEGLNKAHQMGIIHRDIKSANILVDAERRPKILDFGLATFQGGERLTKVGSTIGTVAYMSPEQALGGEVDQRSDLFSLGVVIYELIGARTPFKRDNDAATMKAITQDDPEPLARYRANVPDELQRIVSKLLERDPSLRYQTASGIISDLKKLQVSGSSNSVPVVPKKTNRLMWISGAAAVVVLALVAVWALMRTPTAVPVAERAIKLTTVTNNGRAYSAAISPDGKYLAYAEGVTGKQSLSVRQIATSSIIQLLPPSELAPSTLTFTPDGNYITYTANDKSGNRSLYRIPALGGAPQLLLADVTVRACWSPDGTKFAYCRVFQSTGDFAVMVVNADGTGERRVIGGKAEIWYQGSVGWSPDGKLLAVDKGMWQPRFHHEVVVVQVEDGKEIWSTSGNWWSTNNATWEQDGKGLLFCATEPGKQGNAQIVHVTYPGGVITRVTSDLANYFSLTLTSDNKLISAIHGETRSSLWQVPQADRADEARQITYGRLDGANGVTWMPDGRVLYTSMTADGTGLWTSNSDGTDGRQLLGGSYMILDPLVTPDGKYIVYVSAQAGLPNIWRADIDGQNIKQLTFGTEDYRPSISPDGKWVVYDTWKWGPDLLVKIPIDGGEPQKLSDVSLGNPKISPDGKLIACMRQEVGKPVQFCLLPFTGGEPVKSFDLPPTGSGIFNWSNDSGELHFIDDRNGCGNIWAINVTNGAMRQVTNFKAGEMSAFSWGPDHKQLVVSRGSSANDAVLISGYR